MRRIPDYLARLGRDSTLTNCGASINHMAPITYLANIPMNRVTPCPQGYSAMLLRAIDLAHAGSPTEDRGLPNFTRTLIIPPLNLIEHLILFQAAAPLDTALGPVIIITVVV
jgi:hypothetical protein